MSAIDARAEATAQTLARWCAQNSGSRHLEGLALQAEMIEAHLDGALEASVERVSLDPAEEVGPDGAVRRFDLGEAIRITARPEAPIQIAMTGHYDTVFPKDSRFRTPRVAGGVMNGPGAADMKGGLLIMIEAMRALERSAVADKVGVKALISPDEEIGSPGSAPHLSALAKACDLGLTFEPATSPDGTLAGARKGSANMTAIARGRPAHAGREPEKGRNAVVLLAEFVARAFALNGAREGLTLNPARLEGGGPSNVVPDLAICRFNIRVKGPEDQAFVLGALEDIRSDLSARDGFALDLHGHFQRPPKILTNRNTALFHAVKDCGAALGQTIDWKPTGGCCEGNNLAAAGLPNVDTLGVRGGKIHSEEEFAILESLAKRAKLAGLFLMRLGRGDFADLLERAA